MCSSDLSIYEKYKKIDDNDQENYSSQIIFLQKSLEDLEGIDEENVALKENINELKEEVTNLIDKNKILKVRTSFHFYFIFI